MKPLPQTTKLILAILIIVVLGVGGWIMYPTLFLSKQPPTNTNVSQNQNNKANINAENTNTQPANLNASVDTSNWKTYRNEELGFEVKYPEEWRVEKNEEKKYPYFCPQESSELCNQMHIEAHANPDQLMLREFYAKSIDTTGSIVDLFKATKKYQEVNFEPYEAVKFYDVPDFVSSTIISLNAGKMVFEFVNFGQNHQADGIFDSFIRSFKVLKK